MPYDIAASCLLNFFTLHRFLSYLFIYFFAANMMSPGGSTMSPSSNLMSPASNVMAPPNDLSQRSPISRRYPAVNTSIPYQSNSNHTMASHHVMESQQRHYANVHTQINTSQHCNLNPQMSGHLANYTQPLGLHHGPHMGMLEQPIPHNYHSHHVNSYYNQEMPNFHPLNMTQHPYAPSHYPIPPTSVTHNLPHNAYANPNQIGHQEASLTPRPPSHSASTTSNRHRLIRMRNNYPVTSQQNRSCPAEPCSSEQSSSRINCPPDPQV